MGVADSKHVRIWLVTIAMTLVAMAAIGRRPLHGGSQRLAFWCGGVALLVLIVCQFLPKFRRGRGAQPKPCIAAEIQSSTLRSSEVRCMAGEDFLESRVLLKVSITNVSPARTRVVGWKLRVELNGSECGVEGPLYLAGNGLGLSELELDPEQCAEGWLAFLVRGVSAEELPGARLVLRLKDYFGSVYEAVQPPASVAA